MTAILESESVSLEEEAFQDFFSSVERDQIGVEAKYRRRLAKVATSQGRSLTIDFDDLVTFDPALARRVVERPDEYLDLASRAATAQLRVADPDYVQRITHIHARFRRLPEKTLLRQVGAEHLKKLILVDGIVVRASQVRPRVVKAAYRCIKCAQLVREEEAGELMRGLGGTCPHCKQKTAFELLQSESEFKNTQEVRVQERPEDLPPGQLPRYLDVRLEDDLVDTARPGDRVALTALVRAERPSETGEARGRAFDLYLEANYVDIAGKEAELVEISSEDEKKILEAASDPWIHRNLVRSLAPSIHGYEDIKEAILYVLFGGVQKQLPDGIRIRGELNTLLIGDPGCLIGDERIVLADGTIAKMDELGRDHLQDIRVQVLTGEGGAKRDLATKFHIYRNQPTIEIVTESGKSVRGTYNHPLLAVETVDRTLVRRWKRLDEFRVRDRVAVVTGFPCTVTNHVVTEWHPLPYRRGPRFRGKLPARVTPELAALLGYVLGGGFVQRYRIGFTVAEGEKDILQPLCGLAEELFGIRPRVSSGKRKSRTVTLHEAVIGSQDIAKNLEFLRQKRIPRLINSSGNEVLSSFLRWLYEADGTVYTAKRGCGAIGLKARNLELLRDVQVLLLRFGVHSRIIGNALLTRRGESILKFAKKVGFASIKKRARLADLVERAQKLKRFTRQRSERIVSIRHREPADVYDVEVPVTHRFIANGVVSHNTAKSQLLQYVAKIAPRGLYTSGRGSTAAGLTAAVLREKTGGMVLEAGALVLADKGIACLHPDSRVLFEGVPTHIADLFDAKTAMVARTKRGHLLRVSRLGRSTVNLRMGNLRTRETTASVVTERDYEGSLLRIRMKSGFELRVTPDHLLLDGPRFRWRPAGEVRIGDRLLTVQRLPERHEKIRVMDVLPDDWIVQPSPEEREELRKRVLQRFPTLATANRHYGLRREALTQRDAIPLVIFRRLLSDLGLAAEWRNRAFAYGRRKRTERLRVASFTPELAYILGFIYGDGYARSDSKHSKVSITQSEGHRRYIDRLLLASRATFNTSWGDLEKPGSSERAFRVHQLHRSSNLLFGLYDWVTRDALRNLLRLDQDSLAGFLAGAMDADGCVSTKRYTRSGKEYQQVEVVFSLSDDVNDNRSLLLALRRFDVYARIRQQKGVKIVQITGRDDATRLLRALAPYSAKYREIPTRLRDISADNEEVPAPLLARVLRNVHPDAHELLRNGGWSTFHELRAETRRPFKSSVRRLGYALATWLSPEQSASLDALASVDYAMDEVVGIEAESYKGPVYDLRVPDGASFLADGICVHNCVDEIDKMREDDRVAIHEALEQQTVSVAKGGIVATLNARAAVLAAGNPEYGRYVPERNVTENINLPVTLLSRFDLIFIIRDKPEADADSRMSEHILALHKTQSHPEAAAFAPEFLRKYVSYAKRIIPILTPEAVKEIQGFYLNMRSKSGTEGAIAITPRQLEALIRIAEARARCFLRNQVTVEDAKGSIRIMRLSLQDAGMDVKTGTQDIDVIMTGKPRSQRDILQRIMGILQELERETGSVEQTVLVNAVVEKERIDETEARRLIQVLIRDAMLYMPKPGILKRTRG